MNACMHAFVHPRIRMSILGFMNAFKVQNKYNRIKH